MERAVKQHAPFLHLLYTAESKQRQVLLETISDKQLQILSEVILNVYKGILPISRYYISKLKPYRQDIENIIDPEIRKKDKIKMLIHNHVMIPLLLKPIQSML